MIVNSFVLAKGEAKVIDYIGYFESSFDEESSHADCLEVHYEFNQGENCDQPLSKFSLGSDKVILDSNSAFVSEYLCIKALT